MPTEVLVMCTRCGRPQPARTGNCVACGEVLPEAPVAGTSSPDAPFLLMEGSGGRSVTAMGRKVAYRAGGSAAPVVLELGTLQSVTRVRRMFLEALALVPVAIVLTFLVPAARPVAAGLSGLGLLVAVLWRRYSLALKTRDGGNLRWSLGLARLASPRLRGLDAAWGSGALALASRGVSVGGAAAPPGPGA
ncbi:MAG: hypothetical protein ACJ8AT_10475 [Hyalangium sp.]|uniref:hypothetical protein n=1 Tax=Hyalangium sp. TaxID=2028555 RepID=UPI00389A8B85